MKSKLVKYPYNVKKYRWDSYKMGKKFEYTWDESMPKNFTTIEPYVKAEPFEEEEGKHYAAIFPNDEVQKSLDFNEDQEYFELSGVKNIQRTNYYDNDLGQSIKLYKTIGITKDNRAGGANNAYMYYEPMWKKQYYNGSTAIGEFTCPIFIISTDSGEPELWMTRSYYVGSSIKHWGTFLDYTVHPAVPLNDYPDFDKDKVIWTHDSTDACCCKVITWWDSTGTNQFIKAETPDVDAMTEQPIEAQMALAFKEWCINGDPGYVFNRWVKSHCTPESGATKSHPTVYTYLFRQDDPGSITTHVYPDPADSTEANYIFDYDNLTGLYPGFTFDTTENMCKYDINGNNKVLTYWDIKNYVQTDREVYEEDGGGISYEYFPKGYKYKYDDTAHYIGCPIRKIEDYDEYGPITAENLYGLNLSDFIYYASGYKNNTINMNSIFSWILINSTLIPDDITVLKEINTNYTDYYDVEVTGTSSADFEIIVKIKSFNYTSYWYIYSELQGPVPNLNLYHTSSPYLYPIESGDSLPELPYGYRNCFFYDYFAPTNYPGNALTLLNTQYLRGTESYTTYNKADGSSIQMPAQNALGYQNLRLKSRSSVRNLAYGYVYNEETSQYEWTLTSLREATYSSDPTHVGVYDPMLLRYDPDVISSKYSLGVNLVEYPFNRYISVNKGSNYEGHFVPSITYMDGYQFQLFYYNSVDNNNTLIDENFIKARMENTAECYILKTLSKKDLTSTSTELNRPKYVIEPEDWTNQGIDLKEFSILSGAQLADAEYIIKPQLKLIGDKTDAVVTVPENNSTILSYVVGNPSGGLFNEKSLLINAPSDYDTSGNVTSRTWLTYNKYTAEEWEDEFHYKTATDSIPWNNPMSPFAYCNGLDDTSSTKTFSVMHSVCTPGTYLNIYKLDTENYPSVSIANSEDSNVLTYITDPTGSGTQATTQFNTWVGSLWYPGSGEVKSNSRNAYPDDGVKDGYYYMLKPQVTKFVQYYRDSTVLSEIELKSDRYTYSHETTDLCDRSYEGTTCGTSTSTGEDTIPDANWREYLGLYLGESIPSLGLTYSEIAPSVILDQPQYNKEVNTSETVKYGTVASASITFTVNQPIATAKNYNDNYLILYYDFENNNDYKMMGWFYVDAVEAIDEYSSRITAHDEIYKLNKYVDDFMNGLVGTSTLDATYRALLTYCDCQYDEQYPTINNGSFVLYNNYNTAKTTGITALHYIAQIAPGFIEANSEGDVVLSTYQATDYILTTGNYSDLTYTPFTSDILNKVKILINNSVRGQDGGNGTKAYYIEDSPIIAQTHTTNTLDALAQSVLDVYKDIPTYRPATVQLLTLPEIATDRLLSIGDCINIVTKTGDSYNILVMKMDISPSGITITSMGQETYPVEQGETTSQFNNIINSVDNLDTTTAGLQQTINGFGVRTANNLATITLNGTTTGVALQDYVDNKTWDASDVTSGQFDISRIPVSSIISGLTHIATSTSGNVNLIWLGNTDSVSSGTGVRLNYGPTNAGFQFYENGTLKASLLYSSNTGDWTYTVH